MAQVHNLPLVIDSAAGFGSTYASGDPLGARGDCEVSFLPRHQTLAVGVGGAITSEVSRGDSSYPTNSKNFGFNQYREAVSVGTERQKAHGAVVCDRRSPAGVRFSGAYDCARTSPINTKCSYGRSAWNSSPTPSTRTGLCLGPYAVERRSKRLCRGTRRGRNRVPNVLRPPGPLSSRFSRWAGLASLPVTADISARCCPCQ